MPLFIALLTNSYSQWPVTAVITGCIKLLSYKSYLILVVVSYPSMKGILQSIRIKSYFNFLSYWYLFLSTSSMISLIASRPSKQKSQVVVVCMPILYLRIIKRASMLKDWSSTIRIFPGGKLIIYLRSS